MILVNAHILESFARQPETVDAGGDAAITRNLKEDLLQFIFGETVLNSAANMQLQLMRAVERRDHSQIENAAATAIEARDDSRSRPSNIPC